MITELHARNYGCLRDVVAAHLSPIHAFIGPNDSGKSTLLRAARVLAVFAGDAPNPDLFEMQLESASAETPISLASRTPPGAYRVVFDGTQYPQDGMSEHLGAAPQALPLQKRPWGRPRERARANHGPILGELGPARIVRHDPDHLRQATA